MSSLCVQRCPGLLSIVQGEPKENPTPSLEAGTHEVQQSRARVQLSTTKAWPPAKESY